MPDNPSPPQSNFRQRSTHLLWVSRRGFCRHAIIVAATAPFAAPLRAAGDDLHRSSEVPESVPEQEHEADAKLANIIRKYGARLSNDQRQHLRRILIYNENMLASVRAFPLQNDDAPASVLKSTPRCKTTAESTGRTRW